MDGLKGFIAFVCSAVITGLIGGAIGGNAIFDGFLGVVVGIGLLIGLTYFFYNLFDRASNNIKTSVDERNDNIRLKNQININEQVYQTAKNTYKYFSDEKIMALIVDENQKETIERLALEETAVDRGLIDHSPMHEKLYHLKNFFQNEK